MSSTMLGEILVVEENPADLKLLSGILSEAGYKVRPASDGAFALRSIEAKVPDLVILDVHLPDVSGVDICLKLKADPGTRDIPVIFISAVNECDLKVQALEAGGTDYVMKPIQATEVLARIKCHLKMYRLQQKLLAQAKELKKEIEGRKKTETLNTRLSHMLEESVNEIYVFDFESFHFVHCNQRARNNLGYSREEMKELTFFDIRQDLSPEEFAHLVEPLRSGAKDAITFKARLTRKYDSTYPVEIHLQLMPEDTPLFIAVVMDVSERNRSQELLRQSEERFRTALDAADDCIFIWNKRYNYIYANKSGMEHLGSTSDQVIGKNIRDNLGHVPDFMNLWMSRIDQVFASGKSLRFHDETTMQGRQVYTDSILSPLRNAKGLVNAVYVVYRDISELRLAEKELIDTHDIINRSPAIAFLWNNAEGWPVEYVSGNVEDLLGYSDEDFISGKIQYANLIHPDDLDCVAGEVGRYSADNNCQGFTHEPYRLITKSGEVVWVDDRTNFRRDSEGNITHFQGMVMDITANVAAENERKRLEKSLYQSDKMASIGQLAAGVAHEVNNPIGFISSNLKTMLEYLQELKQHCNQHDSIESNEEVVELFSDFEEAIVESLDGSKRVKKIVADMMGISRPGTDKLEYSDFNEGLESTLNIVWNEIKYNCEVEKDFGAIPLVECYQNKINQVFLNLLVNAGHATKNQSGHIWIKTWADTEQVHVSIRDDGCGIPPENIHQLFEAFFTTKEVGQGTGLGLSLSHDIVRQHGGTIAVESEVGRGTEFIVSLPIVAVTAAVELSV